MEKILKRIIIADDHAVVRTGLQLILDDTPDMAICDEASNGDELLEKLHQNNYDLVILDICMPGKETTEILTEIKNTWKHLPVVIFSMNPDEIYAMRMIKNGASAYINKEIDPHKIVEILRIVLTGKKYFTEKQIEMLANLVSEGEDNVNSLLFNNLTDREFEIMFLLASGKRKREIADKLKISKNTIGNHRSSILKKLNLNTNSELTRYAISNGIIK